MGKKEVILMKYLCSHNWEKDTGIIRGKNQENEVAWGKMNQILILSPRYDI